MNVLQMLKSSINNIYAKYINDNKLEDFSIFYVGGSQTLPPPLEPKEEVEVIERLSKGDIGAKKI